ncbi:MAG TPA: aldehyde dehydrogenase family protein, partial [Gemmatimonadales bacterium]
MAERWTVDRPTACPPVAVPPTIPLMPIASTNPATGQTIRSFQPLSPAQLEAKLQCAADAYQRHRRTSFAERSKLMLRAAEILESEKDAFGRIMVTEMGKTHKAAMEEAAKSGWGCRYYAENAERFLAEEVVPTSASRSVVTYQPIGPVLAIMPWNFPFWQVFRFAAPSLMAGNVGVLKHASNVSQCALAIEEVFQRAGFPTGVFQTVLVPGSKALGLVEDPRIAAVTLTGSEEAGARVAEASGRALKPTVLELGGSDPFIVLDDADVEAAARVAIDARFQNAGQSCIAAKRFIVVESAADEFQERFRNGIEELVVGDPMDGASKIGPLAKGDLVDTLEEQVRRSVSAGASIVTGGRRLDRRGYFYAPTLIS